ncbi:UDP-glycosyltransferase 92A1 [Ricinus communis]|uniref:Glycosyltransferase n=1 Tax=Ricinus communis TaxID=3988 RepID=B9SUM4_RICCO|nr:UDP-glycosyltransferase 92A1 [Ricinus communis]EEF32704.1 UDP-glucosyltransferase, putative [Ricinus communis]|eukprot:XP_002529693.1 UDP-glycosyltransferase 92A1 [Ricinus communis]
MESKSKSNEHIVMLPFMAHGHLIPFLALARQIHQRSGFRVTIANTPLNIQYLRSTMNSPEPNNINFIELPFSVPAEYGLPPNTENSENLPLDLIGKFFAASTSLANPVHNLLSDIVAKEGKPPLCIISDVFFGWASDVAKSFGTVNVSFTTGGAYGSLAYISVWLSLPHRQYAGSDEFPAPGFPDGYRFHISQLHKFIRDADGTDIWSKFMQKQISLSLQSFGFLCNTVEEIEPLGLDLFRKYVKLPVWTTGPLLPPDVLNGSSLSSSGIISSQRAGKQFGISTEKCLQFLDLHMPCSVLYISFGSQNSINPAQLMELAIGLEESAKPFIWVIRPPVGFDRRGEFKAEWLPDGFEHRISSNKKGLLVRNWAPQLEILSHKSTGAFLSHCGWNSVIESLSQGVPIIGWPLAAEQAYNSKMLVEEMGVGVELTRGLQTSIEWKEAKKVIELAMDLKGKGNDMRKKATEIGKLIRESVKDKKEEKGSSVKALDDFVRILLSRREGGGH